MKQLIIDLLIATSTMSTLALFVFGLTKINFYTQQRFITGKTAVAWTEFSIDPSIFFIILLVSIVALILITAQN